MEQMRSKKAKSLRAARRQPVNNKVVPEILGILDTQTSYLKGLAPPHTVMKIQKCTHRFALNGNFSANFQVADLFNQFLVATSSTTAVTYVDVVRIRRIKVWCRNNEQDYSCQVALTPAFINTSGDQAGFKSVPKTYGVESQSSAYACVLDIKPGRLDALGNWYRSTTNTSSNLFSLQTSAGGGAVDQNTMIDISFEYLVNLNGTVAAYTVSGLSSLTTGFMGGLPIFGGLGLLLDMNVL
jgi:hypothetical protein